MKNGTYNLSFVMMYTVTSQSGATVHVPFGEDYHYTVTVSTPTSSVASSGLSKFIKSGTPKAIIPQNVDNLHPGLHEQRFNGNQQTVYSQYPGYTGKKPWNIIIFTVRRHNS